MRHLGGWLLKARAKEWMNSVKRYGPYLVGGAVWGSIGINPWRTDEYSRFWMAMTGIFLVFFIRSIAVQVIAARKVAAAREAELQKFLAEMEAAK
jgi:hypothetical protein